MAMPTFHGTYAVEPKLIVNRLQEGEGIGEVDFKLAGSAPKHGGFFDAGRRRMPLLSYLAKRFFGSRFAKVFSHTNPSTNSLY